MSFERDLLTALETATAPARAALAEAKDRGDALRAAQSEIALLRMQLATLTRIVAALAGKEVDGNTTPAQLGKRLRAIAAPFESSAGSDE